MCQSATSSTSPDQPRHVSCISTAMPMWTVDPRARQITNEAYELFQFNQLAVSHNTRAQLLLSAFNHACASVDGAQHVFNDHMRKMDDMADGDKDVVFDEQVANL